MADHPLGQQLYRRERFPCLNPVNPDMMSFERRIATFAWRWPKLSIRATFQQLAKAGFFFQGELCNTKCFYCNVRIENCDWEHDDEPWTEHAKRSPGCEFVLATKGIEFVRSVQDNHLNLNRSVIPNSVSLDVASNEVQPTPRNKFTIKNGSSHAIDVMRLRHSAEQQEGANSCGMPVENFILGDDGMDTRWHESACRMSAGPDDITEPIPEPDFRSRDDPSKEAISLANIVDLEHQIPIKSANLRSESEKRLTRGEYSGNIPMPNSERPYLDSLRREMLRFMTTHREPPGPSEEEQHQLAERFPCRNPMNPHMKSLESRIATFDRRWSKERIRPRSIRWQKQGCFF